MQLRNLLLGLSVLSAPAVAQCLTINNAQPGTNLQLGDDTGRVVQLPFPFLFNGQVYTEIAVCSNGYVWLGQPPAANPWDFTDSEAEFLSQPPRIAPLWDDLNPGSPLAGGVFFFADAASANITWKNVPFFGSSTNFVNIELVLGVGGTIVMHYESSTQAGGTTSISGITAGNGAAPAQLNWLSFPAVANATGYQLHAANTVPLIGRTVLLTPSSASGYQSVDITNGLGACPPLGTYPPLASTSTYGAGCPNLTQAGTGTFFELFPSGAVDLSNTSILFQFAGGNTYVALPGPGFDNGYGPGDALTQGDDTQVTVAATAMGGFPFLGSVVTSMRAASNGFLWLAPNTSSPFTVSETTFATSDPRIAPLWGDWNFNLGGTFYWTATATHCLATWENVAAFGRAGTQNTFQVKLFPNGDVVFSYGAVLNNSTTTGGNALAGLSGGGSTGPTTSIDLGSVLTTPTVFDLTPFNVRPLRHVATSNPSLGGQYRLEVQDIPTGTALGVFLLSFTRFDPGIDLTSIGMPGCSQYVGLDARIVTLVTGPTMSLTVPIPPNLAYAGVQLATQGATFSGITPLGVISSNGVVGTIGY